MKKNTGFTILELMMVVAIVGILAMVGASSFERSTRRAAMREAVTTLKTSLDFSRSHARDTTRATFIYPTKDISVAVPVEADNWQALNDGNAPNPGWVVYADLDQSGDATLTNPVGGTTLPPGTTEILSKTNFNSKSERVKFGNTSFGKFSFTSSSTTANRTIVIQNVKGSEVLSYCRIVIFRLARVRKEGEGCL